MGGSGPLANCDQRKRWLSLRYSCHACGTVGNQGTGRPIDLPCPRHPVILLMEEILHHLGWLKPINNGIIIILGGAGFCSSTYHLASWWFQTFFYVQLYLGKIFPFWPKDFSDGLVETTTWGEVWCFIGMFFWGVEVYLIPQEVGMDTYRVGFDFKVILLWLVYRGENYSYPYPTQN